MERMNNCLSSSSLTSFYTTTKKSKWNFLAFITYFLLLNIQIGSGEYYGKLIGKLSELHHGVGGQVYAVDSRTIFIKDFTYDGEGPAAYFYIGNSRAPIINGIKLRDEKGMVGPLKKYNKKGITLSLPDGKSLSNIRWFSVYCDDYSVNFGDVRIPRGFNYPKPQKLASLNGVHDVSSEPIVIVDAQTLLIPAFSYDGEAPDAKFWVGYGNRPSSNGTRIPDENGRTTPLRLYHKKTIVLTLPANLTVHEIGYFGVWCEAFTVDFGHIQIPLNLNIPPSLDMLGISPQSKLNCEVLEDNLAFEVRWAVAGDSIVIQLVGKLDTNQYMAFGLSSDPKRSLMIGGDVVVAWVDKQTLQGYAVDYILDAKSQCSGSRGSCPDTRVQDNTDSIRLLNAALVNGYSIVTYQRPLIATDELDISIMRNNSQAIIWAIGPLNDRNEVSFHSHFLKGVDKLIEFARPPTWNCPMPDIEQHYDADATNDKFNNTSYYNNHNRDNKNYNEDEIFVVAPTTRRPLSHSPSPPAAASTKDAWVIPPIQCDEPDDGVFYAQMGPTGGKHGYPAITGHVGWGISWYINGLLIPEINVVRGKTYTFIIEGGDTPDVPARYHPFYITDDPIGGYEHKTSEEKSKVKIFAGAARQHGSTIVRPTGVGRFCFWRPDPNHDANDFSSFGAYQRTLTLNCDGPSTLPGNVQWTPDKDTPNTVYYQCYSHRYLGWKINVLDSCDVNNKNLQSSSSDQHEIYTKPDFDNQDAENGESIRVFSNKVIPEQNYHNIQADHPHLNQHQHQYHYYNHHHPQQQQHPSAMLHYPNSHHDYYYSHYMQPAKSTIPLQLTSAYLRDPYKSQILPSASTIKQKQQQQQQHYYHHHHQQQQQQQQEQQQQPQQQQQQQLQQQQQQQQQRRRYYHNNNNNKNNHNNQLNTNNAQHYNHAYYHRRVTIPLAHHYNHHHHHPPSPHHHHHHHQQQLQQQHGRLKLSTSTVGPLENVDEMSQATSTIINTSINPNSYSNFITDSRPIVNIASMKYPNQQQKQQSYLYKMKSGQLMQTVNPHGRVMMKESPSILSQVVIPPSSNNGLIYRSREQLSPPKIEAKISLLRDTINDKEIMNNNDNITPARNTGFNPSSIIIEGGFKPIIRQYENSNNIQHDSSNKIRLEKLIKPRLNDNMEMLANVLDMKYLPSSTAFNATLNNDSDDNNNNNNNNNNDDAEDDDDDNNNNNSVAKRTNVRRSTDITTLITFDGKKVRDLHNLTGTITATTRRRNNKNNENNDDSLHHINNGRLSSDVLINKVPQFRKFIGELPPQIPRNITNVYQLNPLHNQSRRLSPTSSLGNE